MKASSNRVQHYCLCRFDLEGFSTGGAPCHGKCSTLSMPVRVAVFICVSGLVLLMHSRWPCLSASVMSASLQGKTNHIFMLSKRTKTNQNRNE